MSASESRVTTRAGVIELLCQMSQEAKIGGESFPNSRLPDFLEAFAGWLEDMDGFYENNNIPIPQHGGWEVLADGLRAAKVYE